MSTDDKNCCCGLIGSSPLSQVFGGRNDDRGPKFAKLTFHEQSHSIEDMINHLQNLLEYHLKISPTPEETQQRYLKQIQKLSQMLQRPSRLGILKGKASYKIKEDFEITDSELAILRVCI
jgi:hypothetical protein